MLKRELTNKIKQLLYKPAAAEQRSGILTYLSEMSGDIEETLRRVKSAAEPEEDGKR